jgi:uncharacterized protein
MPDHNTAPVQALRPLALRPFPICSIAPQGWLAGQLRTQLDGLSGHLDEFWPDIHHSAWIGGQAEGWERMPYWLDGAIPLAWLTGDPALKARISTYLDHILSHQQADGWLGPRLDDNPAAADLWSQILALKMLVVWHDATGDERVPCAVERALCRLDRHIDAAPLWKWGQFRWFEALIPIWWLYQRSGESWLLDLGVKLHAQGFDWTSFYARWPLTQPTERGRWNFAGHVVNNAMAIKAGPLWWRLSGGKQDRDAASAMIAALDQHHGMVTGAFSGDECLAGTSPIQGTELCAVVEYMYSLEMLLSVLGNGCFGDRLERIAYNALPATFSADMWCHQYDQQVNQIECSQREDRTWNTNGPEANLFGLEPNYGCCTANLSQGWPKLAAHLWMRTADDGIAATAYAPSRLSTTIDGVPVVVTLDTAYPFGGELRFTVRTESPVAFPLALRIPAWAHGARVETQGQEQEAEPRGGYHQIQRTWEGSTRLVLRLPMEPRLVHRPQGAVALMRGPLAFALPIDEEWRRINADLPHRELPHGDWEIYGTSPWNYALRISETSVATDVRFVESEPGALPFSPQSAPVEAILRGRLVPGWEAHNGSAQPLPVPPVETAGADRELRLIPYGCTNLRIAEFPVL